MAPPLQVRFGSEGLDLVSRLWFWARFAPKSFLKSWGGGQESRDTSLHWTVQFLLKISLIPWYKVCQRPVDLEYSFPLPGSFCVCLQIEHGHQEYVIKVMTHDQLNHHSSTCPYKLRLVTPVSPKRPPNVLSDCNSRHFFFSLLCLDQIWATHRVVRKPPL